MVHLRKLAIAAGFAGLALTTAATPSASDSAAPKKPVITVYKDPNCGCCKNWVEHLIKHGYTVSTKDTRGMNEIKRTLGVPPKVEACHTGLVNGYLIEGHVPAADIDRLLKQKPRVAGLAVPGMPMGSPGMEGPRTQHYEVLSFERNGKTRVFASH